MTQPEFPVHRYFVLGFLHDHLPIVRGPILDIGAGRGSPQASWFGRKRCVTADATARSHPHIVADLNAPLPFASGAFNTVICLDALTHALDPRLALAELHRLLRPRGQLLLTVPCLIRDYQEPSPGETPAAQRAGGRLPDSPPPDYWRFTSTGLRLLLAPWRRVEVQPYGNPLLAAEALRGRDVRDVDPRLLTRADASAPLGYLCTARK